MNTISKLKEVFEIESSKENKDLILLSSLAVLIKTISESEKTQEESKKLIADTLVAEKNLSNKSQLYLSLITPILALMTFGFTIYQFNKNYEQQRIATEETQWREFSKQLQDKGSFEKNLTVPSTLISFLKSERFGSQARELSFTILPEFINADKFEDFFTEANVTTTWDNFKSLPKLSRNLTKNYYIWDDKKTESKNKLRDSSIASNKDSVSIYHKQLMIDSLSGLELDKQLNIVSNAIVTFIKRADRPKNEPLPLRGSFLFENNLSDLNLSKADLRDTRIEACNVTNTNFGEVVDYLGSNWDKTAWWKSSRISDSLTTYLIIHFPFKPGSLYYFGNRKYDLVNTEDSLLYINVVKKSNQIKDKTGP